MTEQWNVPAWAVVALVAVLVALVLALVLTIVRGRRRTVAGLDAARAETEALRAQVEALARAAAPQQVTREDREFVITGLGHEAEAGEEPDTRAVERADAVPTVPARLFADMVLRESVVRGATLAAGVRRALAPETRNRIRFEYKREVKRSRKHRRAETREAIAFYRAHQRAALDDTTEVAS
ncbi:hypothetical protein [Nocardioides sp. zg-DK7169]|uniref:hypothetical protein n=1 Tax=Nocardioides sp. zg-DK7169 TaxID=2736600 RepID=UPI001557E890|nr:hypothetical protein [Nocardioides sp. zg-DK7169]NPC96156.1 hypothetical protein [Nocardioides sp. zg-DK7169]